jgi:hypothetical protein
VHSSHFDLALLHLTKDGGNFTLEALTEQWKKELSNAKQNEATQAIVEKDLPL